MSIVSKMFDEKLAIRLRNLMLTDVTTALCEVLLEQRKHSELLGLVYNELKKLVELENSR